MRQVDGLDKLETPALVRMESKVLRSVYPEGADKVCHLLHERLVFDQKGEGPLSARNTLRSLIDFAMRHRQLRDHAGDVPDHPAVLVSMGRGRVSLGRVSPRLCFVKHAPGAALVDDHVDDAGLGPWAHHGICPALHHVATLGLVKMLGRARVGWAFNSALQVSLGVIDGSRWGRFHSLLALPGLRSLCLYVRLRSDRVREARVSREEGRKRGTAGR